MTDSTAAPSAPAAQPAPSASSTDDFEDNIAAFLRGPSLDSFSPDPAAQPEPAPIAQPQPAAQPQAQPPAPAPAQPPVAPVAQPGAQPAPATTPPSTPASAAPAAAPSGTPSAGDQTQPAAVDPALLSQVLLPSAAPQPQPAPAPAPQGGAPEQGDDAPFAPFEPRFQLPQELMHAIFESEDPNTRHQGLVRLVSNIMNTATAVMDERIKSHYAPRFRDDVMGTLAQRSAEQSVQHDFYSQHQDLIPYAHIVQKAGEVIFARNPNQTWTPELRDQIGALARQAVQRLVPGHQVQPAPAPSPAPAAQPAPRATPYVAEGARPAGFGGPVDNNSPAALFDQLGQDAFGLG